MRNVFAVLAAMAASAVLPATVSAGEATSTAQLPNGAVVNAVQLEGSLGSYEKKTVKVAEGVWAVLGQSLVNSYVIEGDTGLIVYDTGDTAHEGAAIAAEIRRLSGKPVVAILYSHAHYAMGAGEIAGAGAVEVLGHPNVNVFAKAGGLSGEIPELAPIQTVRAGQQFGFFLPKSGEDALASATIDIASKRAFLPVTRAVEDGEEIVIDGMRMRFLTRNWADSDSEMTVWLPKRKIVLTNLLWPVAPNLYTPRGDVFRDAGQWAEGLRRIAALEPEIVLASHADPIVGRDKAAAALRDFGDVLAITYDQSVRGILKGLGPDELRGFVIMPARLEGSPYLRESYGQFDWYPESLYHHALGWYDDRAESLIAVSPDFEARETVRLMGGHDAVLAAARDAGERGEHAWSARLLEHLLRIDPADGDARMAKAAALRQLSREAPSSIGHNFLIGQALALEGKTAIPIRAFLPGVEKIAPPCELVRAMRVRIDPARDRGEGALGFAVDGGMCALEVRPGLATFRDTIPQGAPVLTLTREQLYAVYRGAISLENAARAEGAVEGDADTFVHLAGAFEWLREDEMHFAAGANQ